MYDPLRYNERLYVGQFNSNRQVDVHDNFGSHFLGENDLHG